MDLTNSSVRQKRTYIFDLDGVIYRGMELQPHAAEVIEALRSRGDNVRFFTNNATKTRDTFANKLISLGIPTKIEEVMTSAYATALYLADINAAGKTAYQVGERGIQVELEAIGLKVIKGEEEPEAHIDYVVVGLDRNFNYQKLSRAQNAIIKGAKFIATNEDATLPIESGTVIPGGGCMVAAIRIATSINPLVIGKPESYAIDKILQMTNTPREKAFLIGDRLETDIVGGNRAGATSILVLTGVTTRKQAEAAMGEIAPDKIIETLAELL